MMYYIDDLFPICRRSISHLVLLLASSVVGHQQRQLLLPVLLFIVVANAPQSDAAQTLQTLARPVVKISPAVTTTMRPVETKKHDRQKPWQRFGHRMTEFWTSHD